MDPNAPQGQVSSPKKPNTFVMLGIILVGCIIIVIILVLYILNLEGKKQKKEAAAPAVPTPTIPPNMPQSFDNIKQAVKLGPGNFRVVEVHDSTASAITQDIGKFVKLNGIYMERDNFTEIPDSVYSMKNLTTLWFPNNKITALSPKIGNLTNLQVLNVTNNQISSIPKEIGNLTNLQELYIGTNNLKTFPKEIGKLKKLKTVQVEGNMLTKEEQQRIQKLLPQASISFASQLPPDAPAKSFR
ncbi:MAG: leucine-rich repeat domain-containing protein [Candidatus Levyibacteriota bacterium]